jgi:hypothetical protein
MSLFDDPPLHDFPDRAIRRLLADPANLRDLLASLLPDLVDRFDFSRLELRCVAATGRRAAGFVGGGSAKPEGRPERRGGSQNERDD